MKSRKVHKVRNYCSQHVMETQVWWDTKLQSEVCKEFLKGVHVLGTCIHYYYMVRLLTCFRITSFSLLSPLFMNHFECKRLLLKTILILFVSDFTYTHFISREVAVDDVRISAAHPLQDVHVYHIRGTTWTRLPWHLHFIAQTIPTR